MSIMKNSSPQIELTVSADEDGMRCGDFLRKKGVSRRLTTRLKRTDNGITRNGGFVRTVDILSAGDVVSLLRLDESPLEPCCGLSADIVYEDNDIAVYNKPAGMPVHPSLKHQGDTLGNRFAADFPDLTFRPVNRLDRDTSGLCAVAKSAYAANMLNGRIKKVYTAAVEGLPVPHDIDGIPLKWTESGGIYRIETPIGRAGESIIRREVRADGKSAATNYTIIKSNEKFSLLRICLDTGRTHQIRVHFSAVGHPLAGDDFYGGSLEFCHEQALHCSEMSFAKISNGEIVNILCSPRDDILRLFNI